MPELKKFPQRPYPKKAVVTGHLDGFAIRSRGRVLDTFPSSAKAWAALKGEQHGQEAAS